jgi:hypothetical protein
MSARAALGLLIAAAILAAAASGRPLLLPRPG